MRVLFFCLLISYSINISLKTISGVNVYFYCWNSFTINIGSCFIALRFELMSLLDYMISFKLKDTGFPIRGMRTYGWVKIKA